MSGEKNASGKFDEIARRIADGEEPDWAEALQSADDPSDRRLLDALRVIGELARRNRRSEPEEAEAPGSEIPYESDGPSLRPGRRLGAYEIIGRIGLGGMGEVYRARQTQLGRDVAIKTLPWRSQVSLDARQRFEREARLSASLAHRNVVAVHDFCEADGIAFVVEELLEGASWRSIIRDHGGACPRDAARMIGDAAAGVAAAHGAGLVHRDLKPENLLETRNGETKVLDFGLARLLDPFPDSREEGAPSLGSGLGTPTYTAPECLRGAGADQRSDVFALSCSAYELLTGRNPFRRGNTGDTIVALLKETPEPLARSFPGVPGRLIDLVERGLSKQPEDRPTADEIAKAATGPAAEPEGIQRRERPGRKKLQLVSAALGVGLLIGALVYLRLPPEPVAVVLFDSSAVDNELAYVAVALSERLNERLSKASGLNMVSRLVIGQRPGFDPQAGGRELGARRVVTGRLSANQKTLIADVRIIEVSSGRREWEQRFEGSAGDLEALEGRIVEGVAKALGVSRPWDRIPAVRARPINPEAHRLYAEGRYRWFRRTPNELYKAINLFTHALSLEPDYPLALAGLSRAYVDLTYYVPGVSSRETRVVARKAAERALALDPGLVRGITALGDVEAAAWNRDLAHRLYERAMSLDPTDPDAYLGEADDVLLPLGRFKEARALLEKGLGLDVSSLARESLARISYYERDFDRALAEFQQVLESDPGFVSARYRVGQVLLAKGRAEEALVPLWEADRQTRGLAKGRALIVYALAAAGRRREAESLLAGLLKEREKSYVSSTLVALAHVGLGQRDLAFEWLQRGCEEHAEWMHLVAVEPLLDPLRNDARFSTILKCAGLSHP